MFFSIAACANKIGGITPPVDTTEINPVTSDFSYSLYDMPYSNYYKRSAFAVLKINTNSQVINVDYYSPLANANTLYITDGIISIYDENWNYINKITPVKTPDLQTASIDLGATGIYYIVESGNSGYNITDFAGSYVQRVSVDTSISILSIPKTANRIVSIGDSISVGDGSTLNSRYAWAIRLRESLRATDWSLTSDGWGAAYIKEMASTDALQQGIADRALAEFNGATGRKVFLWVLGTNDFGYVVSDPVVVADYAGKVWDKINAVDNTVEVILITPIYRNNQSTANSGGWVLQDYRDALTAEANTRAFVTAYDGEPIITSSDLTDNVHPNNTGHQKIADYITSIL
jgi:lysophospholipase L1-like esterase